MKTTKTPASKKSAARKSTARKPAAKKPATEKKARVSKKSAPFIEAILGAVDTVEAAGSTEKAPVTETVTTTVNTTEIDPKTGKPWNKWQKDALNALRATPEAAILPKEAGIPWQAFCTVSDRGLAKMVKAKDGVRYQLA